MVGHSLNVASFIMELFPLYTYEFRTNSLSASCHFYLLRNIASENFFHVSICAGLLQHILELKGPVACQQYL